MSSTAINDKTEVEKLTIQVAVLVDQVKELKWQNDWLNRQLFGQKSEKRV